MFKHPEEHTVDLVDANIWINAPYWFNADKLREDYRCHLEHGQEQVNLFVAVVVMQENFRLKQRNNQGKQ